MGKLWVISNRGLCIVKTNGEKVWINRQNGLSSNNLFSIEYFEDALWIGSDKGIDRLQLDHRYRLQKIEFFGKNKGFLGEEINSLGCLQSNGKMYFATINGLFIYNPGNYVLRNRPPDLYISEIALNYRKINWEKEWPHVPLRGGLPQGIVFDPNQNYLTFYFNAIDFNSPENVRIQFMLQGLDTAWINATGERQATYSNLSSGNYVFKVRATNDNFTWGTPATFRFTINAPFWKKTWFIVLLIPALLIFGYLLSQWRTRRLRRVQARLKLKVDERTRELRYKNDELEKLSIVASKTNDGVLICDRNGRIVFVNDGFKRMTSFSAEAFDKSEYNKHFLQELSSQNNIEDLIKQIRETGRAISYESTHQLPDGNIKWTHASLTPIFNEDALDKIIVIYTDITDRVITEHALIQTNKDITDSIHYAKKIQEAILPSQQILRNNFPQSFIFYRPRDIVSGDFYWFTRIRNVFVLACADCTGHGVPGAMMTMIGNEFLHQIVNNAMVTGPDVALNLLDKQISRAMNTDTLKKEARDGMDIGLCVIDINSLGTKFAGAGIPMYVVRGNEILEYDALKVSIGSPKTDGQTYNAHEFTLQKGDMLYFTTDGFIDQLGGEKGRKYMRKRFKEFVAGMANLDPEAQQAAIAREYEEHRAGFPQTDDVLVMGIRI
jgi:PAS domain S-box-containing protein